MFSFSGLSLYMAWIQRFRLSKVQPGFVLQSLCCCEHWAIFRLQWVTRDVHSAQTPIRIHWDPLKSVALIMRPLVWHFFFKSILKRADSIHPHFHFPVLRSPLGCLHLRLLCHFLIGSCLLLGQRPEHGLSCSWRVLPPADLMDRSLPRCKIDKKRCRSDFMPFTLARRFNRIIIVC